MSTPETPNPAETEKKGPVTDPYEMLAQVGGPTRDQIETIKQSSPNGRVLHK
jgi:hypothetical protein